MKRLLEISKGMDEFLLMLFLIDWNDCGELMFIKRLDEDGVLIKDEDEFVFL